MIQIQVLPDADCPICYGQGIVNEYHPYGNTVALEQLYCECVFNDLTDDENEMIENDEAEVEVLAYDF